MGVGGCETKMIGYTCRSVALKVFGPWLNSRRRYTAHCVVLLAYITQDVSAASVDTRLRRAVSLFSSSTYCASMPQGFTSTSARLHKAFLVYASFDRTLLPSHISVRKIEGG